MTQFANKRFSVSQSGRSPEDCGHGWIVKGRCWYCGVPEITACMDDLCEAPATTEPHEWEAAAELAARDLATETDLWDATPSPPEPSE